MKLAETNYDNSETGCCARLDEKLWHEREFEWSGRLFLRDHIHQFLHIPLNFGSVISRDQAKIEGAAAYPEDPIWLVDEVSPWGAEVYIALDREVPDAQLARLSGTFLTKVFEGPYKNAGRWGQEMQKYVESRGKELIKLYYFYATCPQCAEYYNKNQTVLFAQVS